MSATTEGTIEQPENDEEAADLIRKVAHAAEPGLHDHELAALEAVETYLRNRAEEGSDAS